MLAAPAWHAGAVGTIQVARAYDPPQPEDGVRVLVDRLWPRGLRTQEVGCDEWLRDVAPSAELRRWYGHDPVRFEEFRSRYLAELDDPAHEQPLHQLRALVRRSPVTLVTASRDVDHSHARVLADHLAAF